MEPVFRIRAHPTIQDFACSGEAWGIADFRVLLNQLSKMKFSRVNIYPFGYQPYLHWKSKGIERRSAWLWYDYHYPITPDMVGRELFGDSKKFWNPDLPEDGSYQELVAAGEAAGPQPDRACPPARTGNQQLCGHHAVPSGIRPPAERCPEGSATRSTDGGSGCLDAGGRSPLPRPVHRRAEDDHRDLSGDGPDHHQHSRVAAVDRGSTRTPGRCWTPSTA